MKKLEDCFEELILWKIHHLIINVVIMNANYITYIRISYSRGEGGDSVATRSNLSGSKLKSISWGIVPQTPPPLAYETLYLQLGCLPLDTELQSEASEEVDETGLEEPM